MSINTDTSWVARRTKGRLFTPVQLRCAQHAEVCVRGQSRLMQEGTLGESG